MVTATIGMPYLVDRAKQLKDAEQRPVRRSDLHLDDDRGGAIAEPCPGPMPCSSRYLSQLALDGAWAGRGLDSEGSTDDDQRLGSMRCWLCDVPPRRDLRRVLPYPQAVLLQARSPRHGAAPASREDSRACALRPWKAPARVRPSRRTTTPTATAAATRWQSLPPRRRGTYTEFTAIEDTRR